MNKVTTGRPKAQKYAYEAIPSVENIIRVPGFHVYAYRNEDNVFVTHCLDFDLYTFSEEKQDKKALDDTFKELCHMVSIHIISYLKEKKLNNLYDNRIKAAGEWEDFSSLNSKLKIKQLKKSLNYFKKNYKTILADRRNSIDISLFTNDPKTSKAFIETVNRLKKLSPDKAQAAVYEMLNIVTQLYRLENFKIA